MLVTINYERTQRENKVSELKCLETLILLTNNLSITDFKVW